MRIILLVSLVFLCTCTPERKDDVWTLKKHYSAGNESGGSLVSETFPFEKWEFKNDSLFIDENPKTFTKDNRTISIYGEDLESTYSITNWTSEEIFLKQNRGDGKEYFLLFKR